MGIMIPPDKKMAQMILSQKMDKSGESIEMAPQSQTVDCDPACEEYANDLMKCMASNDVVGFANCFEAFVSYVMDKGAIGPSMSPSEAASININLG